MAADQLGELLTKYRQARRAAEYAEAACSINPTIRQNLRVAGQAVLDYLAVANPCKVD